MASDFTVDRASKKYVLGSDGNLKEYANDEPAIEFNADGSYKGVLVEPQSINLCLQSEDFGTTWSNGRLDTTSWLNQETAPDGNTTADKIIQASGQTAAGFLQQNITLSAGVHTFSLFAKKGTRNWIRLTTNAQVGSGGVSGVYFDTDTGTTGGIDSGFTANIIEYPNGWYRCSITFTAVASTPAFIIYNAESDNTITVADDGGYQFVWGAQVEASPIATSYIPTTTGAVTRLKDDIYLTSASSLIGQTEGTLFIEVDWQDSGNSQYLLEVSYDFSNRILIYKTSTELRMLARNGGVTLVNLGESSTAYSGIQKIAFAYAENDFELYRNGSSISSDTSGSLAGLPTLNDVDFGQTQIISGQANMWIRSVALFTTRLSDAECEALTTI